MHLNQYTDKTLARYHAVGVVMLARTMPWHPDYALHQRFARLYWREIVRRHGPLW